jgi:hypothetical protein
LYLSWLIIFYLYLFYSIFYSSLNFCYAVISLVPFIKVRSFLLTHFCSPHVRKLISLFKLFLFFCCLEEDDGLKCWYLLQWWQFKSVQHVWFLFFFHTRKGASTGLNSVSVLCTVHFVCTVVIQLVCFLFFVFLYVWVTSIITCKALQRFT